MRPNNSNKRLRGRNRNKNTNPLARSYESNGPDVKIRGSALQVADKYAQLARDAQSSGDRVMAENYFQHAEHYYRIVATAYEQQSQQNQQRDRRDDNREERNQRGNGDQPVINGYDGVEDDDEGVLRALRVNGNGGARDGDGDGDGDAEQATDAAPAVNGSRNGHSEELAEAAAQGDTAEEGDDAPKPRRRSRAPRRPRTRRTDADAPSEVTNEAG